MEATFKSIKLRDNEQFWNTLKISCLTNCTISHFVIRSLNKLERHQSKTTPLTSNIITVLRKINHSHNLLSPNHIKTWWSSHHITLHTRSIPLVSGFVSNSEYGHNANVSYLKVLCPKPNGDQQNDIHDLIQKVGPLWCDANWKCYAIISILFIIPLLLLFQLCIFNTKLLGLMRLRPRADHRLPLGFSHLLWIRLDSLAWLFLEVIMICGRFESILLRS